MKRTKGRSAAAKKAWAIRKQDGWEPERVRIARLEQAAKMWDAAVREGTQLRRTAAKLHFMRPGHLPL